MKASEPARCIVCDQPVTSGDPHMRHYPGEGWVHRECVKDADEGKRWIKGLNAHPIPITQS